MNILCINTAGERIELTLTMGQKTLQYTNDKKEMASVVLLDEIEKLMTSGGISLDEVDYFAAVVGPGSFTGIRIGIATVRAFCQSLKKRCIPVNRLELLAYNTCGGQKNHEQPNSEKAGAKKKIGNRNAEESENKNAVKIGNKNAEENENKIAEENGCIASIVDGQNGVSYVAVYSSDAGRVLREPFCILTSELGEFLGGLDRPTCVVSDSLLSIEGYRVQQYSFCTDALFKFACYKLATEGAIDYQMLEPLYIRKAQAERAVGEL